MKKTIVFILLTAISFSIFAGSDYKKPSVVNNKHKKVKIPDNCTIQTWSAIGYQCPGSNVIVHVATTKTVTTVNCTTGAWISSNSTTTPTGNNCPNTVVSDICDSNTP